MRTLLLILALLANPAFADPERYRLDQERSVVGFGYSLSGQESQGTMPVREADILLDLDRPEQSQVNAVIDAARAQAGLIFATQAMKGAEVLDTESHPTITFRSTRITGQGDRAAVEGNLTVRGVTRPVTLEARIYLQQGAQAGDRDRLSIHLTGDISRSAFGASGFSGLVGDTISLDILTRIDRAP